jgi:hypothetical protein
MNIRMAAVAACALTLGITPAAADLFTIETTFIGTPSVVQVGETVVLHLTVTLIPDLDAAAEGVKILGTSVPGELTISDGTVPFIIGGSPPHSFHTANLIVNAVGYGDTIVNSTNEYTFAVSYDTPGTYSPQFNVFADVVVVGDGPRFKVGFSRGGLTSISVAAVPGPVGGAGLPGLVLAFGGAVTWWRRRRYPQRIQSVPLNQTLMC